MTINKPIRVSILSLALLQFASPAGAPAVEARSQERADPRMTTTNANQSPLACNATALNPQQRQRIRALLNKFRASQQGSRELAAGYSIRLPGKPSMIHDAAELVTLERLCCPFFDFAIEAEREGGPVWLTLAGRDGVKEFARIELGVQPHTNSTGTSTIVRESPLVCNDGALSEVQRGRLVAMVKEFRAVKQETREFPDGYAVRLPGSAAMVQDIADFMAVLRLCSPYFETTLLVECESGPVWLKLTGRDGVKELVKTELGI